MNVSKEHFAAICYVFHAGLFFYLEDGGYLFRRNFG
jgi:hypothetical protein